MLHDEYGRAIDYLRISVTDRCDLRCIFCMPQEGVRSIGHSDILRFEEIEAVVRAGIELGITSVRLTGGEPLARAGIVSLVKKLSAIPGLSDLAMTTNGVMFSQLSHSLLEAGLKRVNFGISSLDMGVYSKITRSAELGDAQRGLDCAIRLGFAPIKVNVVVIRGINEDLTGFINLATEKPVQVRFIEYMPIGPASPSSSFVPASKIRQAIKTILGSYPAETPAKACLGRGPAQNIMPIPNGKGSIAIIAPLTEHICRRCNRLRLTADGKLRPCLFSKNEIDLGPALRPTIKNELLRSLFAEAVRNKPKSLNETDGFGRLMSQIGG
ncbi:MAG: GTP 3',8-cyclase MoaA [Holophagaceae bacterium]|nr:GTP 3',8-cyclase MoaA [Holophagaceae bacterium]